MGGVDGVITKLRDLRVELYVFFQAEDGIRDAQESRGLGDVYKRQLLRDEVKYREYLFVGDSLS